MAEATEQRGLRAALVRIFGGVSTAEADARAKRALQEGFDMGGEDEPVVYTSDGRPIKLGYRQLEQTPRDLSSISQEKANEAAYRLWNTNPLAKALIEIILDYVLGDGAVIQAEDEDVAEALRVFWEDPVNDFDGHGAESYVRELALFGEQLLLAFVRDGAEDGFVADGRLRLGPVDPNQIASIITNSQNRKDILAVRLKSNTGGIDDGPIFKVIHAESADGAEEGVRDLAEYRKLTNRVEKAMGKDEGEGAGTRITESALDRKKINRRLKEGTEWRLTEIETKDGQRIPGTGRMTEAKDPLENVAFDGECFLFQVNKLSTGIRGRSDLLPLIDWLDRYDQLFFDAAEHVQLLNTFVWDLEVQGGSEGATEIEKNLGHQARKVRGARANSVYAHNEKVKLEAKNPDLKTPDIQVMLRALRVFIAGGLRVPEHWLCYSEDTEVLTERGWKRHGDVVVADLIACYDAATERLSFEPMEQFHVYDYQGDMIRFRHGRLDVMVTPEHRMLGQRLRNNRSTEAYETIPAVEMKQNEWRLKVAAVYEGEEQEWFELPELELAAAGRKGNLPFREAKRIRMDDWIQFVAWYLSEGHVDKQSHLILAQNLERYATAMEAAVDALPFEASKRTIDRSESGRGLQRRIVISDKQLHTWMKLNCGRLAAGKHVPDFVYGVDRRQRELFLETIIDGDGDRSNGHGMRYFTVSERLADDIQALAVTCGWRSHISTQERAGKAKLYIVHLHTGKNEVTMRPERNRTDVPYDGLVYCLTVPGGYYVTRRNGKVIIAGNSEGGFTNRATAREMGEPTHRFLSRRQAFVQRMFMRMCQYQIDILVALGLLDEEVSQLDDDGKATKEMIPAREAFDIKMPDINISDTRAASQALSNVANAIFKLDVINMIPARSAMELIAAVADLLGVEIDVEAGLAALEGKDAEKDALANLLKGLDQEIPDVPAGEENGTEPGGVTEPTAEEA